MRIFDRLTVPDNKQQDDDGVWLNPETALKTYQEVCLLADKAEMYEKALVAIKKATSKGEMRRIAIQTLD